MIKLREPIKNDQARMALKWLRLHIEDAMDEYHKCKSEGREFDALQALQFIHDNCPDQGTP